MLSSEQIFRMLDAGFTADEIRSYNDVEPVQGAQENQIPKEETSDVPTETEVTPAAPGPDPAITALTDAVKQLQETVKQMQKSNAKAAVQATEQRVTAEDAIKNFFQKL